MQLFLKQPRTWFIAFLVLDIVLAVLVIKPQIFSDTSEFFSKLSLFKPRPGSCLILEEKYCKLAKLVDNPNSTTDKAAVFKLPKGTVLFAPEDSIYGGISTFSFKDKSNNGTVRYPGYTVMVSQNEGNVKTDTMYIFVYYEDKGVISADKVKKGDAIGSISDKKLILFGDYNLVVGVLKQKTEGGKKSYESGVERLKQLF